MPPKQHAPIVGVGSLRRLPLVKDSISFLYIEHARLEQDALAVRSVDQKGSTSIPCATLTTLLLGPGTSITHGAIKCLAESGCQVVWVGEGATRFYASGIGETYSAQNLLLQAQAWADPDLHLEIARRMYSMRFGEEVEGVRTLEELRGREGARMKRAYKVAAEKAGIDWQTRNYDKANWDKADPVNQALSIANACLYAVCRSAIVSMGFSPGLGFIHTGHALAFAHDVGDLYKVRFTIPIAFREAARDVPGLGARVRRSVRDAFATEHLLETVVVDLNALFEGVVPEPQEPVLQLWNPDAAVSGGRNWSRGQ